MRAIHICIHRPWVHAHLVFILSALSIVLWYDCRVHRHSADRLVSGHPEYYRTYSKSNEQAAECQHVRSATQRLDPGALCNDDKDGKEGYGIQALAKALAKQLCASQFIYSTGRTNLLQRVTLYADHPAANSSRTCVGRARSAYCACRKPIVVKRSTMSSTLNE